MQNKFKKHDKVKHLKSGLEYTILNNPIKSMRLEHSNEPFYQYTAGKGVAWFRCKSEMEDGRFSLIENES